MTKKFSNGDIATIHSTSSDLDGVHVRVIGALSMHSMNFSIVTRLDIQPFIVEGEPWNAILLIDSCLRGS